MPAFKTYAERTAEKVDGGTAMKTKWISIVGAVEVPEGITLDEVTGRLEDWIESQGWHLMAYYEEVEETERKKR
jgi:hypothetical protein